MKELKILDIKKDKIYFNSISQEVSLIIDDMLIESYQLTHGECKYFIQNRNINNKKLNQIRLFSNYFGNRGIHKTNLHFLHIPKCAGTSIENIAYQYGIKWGRFDESIKYSNFPSSKWHKTLYFYDKEELENKDLFTIIRNPYEQMLSFFNKSYSKEKIDSLDNKEFNDLLKVASLDNKKYYPQYQYVYLNDIKLTKNVLKFENLEHDFNLLMLSNNLPLSLTEHTNKSNSKKFNIYDINRKNRYEINKIYEKDFYYFNYDLI